MYQYSLVLALTDYIPIIFSGLGLWFTAKAIEQHEASIARLMRWATLFLVMGGLCKASWKLLIASVDVNLIWLNHALFMFMAPGFTFIAFAMWAGRRQLAGKPLKATAWRCPASATALFALLAVGAAIAQDGGRTWFFILLLQLTVANILFTWHATKYSVMRQNRLAGALYVLNIIGVFAMSGFARVGDPSEAFQWLAQLTNTATQGSLALAGWLLWKKQHQSAAMGTLAGKGI